MTTLEENLFVVGPVASGDSFFGRASQIRELENLILAGVGNRNIVGPTRIGKSSLVQKVFDRNKDLPNRIFIQMSMGTYEDAYAFWTSLAYELRRGIRRAKLWNEEYEYFYNRIDSLVSNQNSGWFTLLKHSLESILRELADQEYRLILALDEFDAVERLFEDKSHYYQEIREICNNPRFSTNGILISRKRLHLFEVTCPYISTFHGVFPEMPILPFSPADMEDFYGALQLYDITLSSGGKKYLERFTGNMPYLCCMFGEKMVLQRQSVDTSFGDKEVTAIFKQLQPQIDRHYDDLIVRLDEDGHLDFIFYLSIGSKFPNLHQRDQENLVVMGTLIPEVKNGETQYYAFSKDFMVYFRLRPLRLPAWDTMTSSETKIKAIFKKEFPRLAQVTYQDLCSDKADQITWDIDRLYPELKLDWSQVRRFGEDLANHKSEPTVLDVLTLSKVISIMLNTWDKRFFQYFSPDGNWKHKLEEIKKLRNPMAHAQIEYINADEMAICMQYCNEIIRMKY